MEYIDLVTRGRSPFNCRWSHRLDPLHEVSWNQTITERWLDPSVIRHRLTVDGSGMVVHELREEFSPIQQSDRLLYDKNSILAVAALHQWEQLTLFQLACMLGATLNQTWTSISALYSAGVVRRLIPGWWQSGRAEDTGTGSVFALHRGGEPLARWQDGLEDLEYLLTTNGIPLTELTHTSASPAALRHNLITSEICLKAMETCPDIAGAWGESFAVGSSLSSERPSGDQFRANIGDAVLVSRDGRLVVLEVTTSMTNLRRSVTRIKSLVEKAAMWTAICGRSELDISVVFVEASTIPRWGGMTRYIRDGIRDRSKTYVSSTAIRKRGQQRIFTANAYDWFPIPRGISDDFLTLRSFQVESDSWVDIIRGEENPRVDSSSDVLINTLAGLHVPSWIVHPLESE